ncbi:MAG: GntR family transcriptional regulator [Solirubrobacteraceae bacterium]
MGSDTKADQIALEIEAAIASGDIPADTVLRQGRLAEQFEVSRTPIREALRLLAAEGLVSFSPNRGVRVRKIGIDELTDAFRIRAELEGLAVELATPRLTEKDHSLLLDAEHRYADLTHRLLDGDGTVDRATLAVEWLRANDEFHATIVRASGSPMLERLVDGVRRQFSGQALWNARGAALRRIVDPGLTEHRLIREAMLAGAPEAARSIMQRHVVGAGEIVKTLLRDVDVEAIWDPRSADD